MRPILLAALLILSACAPHGGGVVVGVAPGGGWGAGPGFHAPRHFGPGPRWGHSPGWHRHGWHHRHGGWHDARGWHRHGPWHHHRKGW